MYDALQGVRMIVRTSGGTPDTGNTKLSTPALRIIVWTVHPPPGMSITYFFFDTPSVRLCIFQGRFNFFSRV
jgi:hypothetical protein